MEELFDDTKDFLDKRIDDSTSEDSTLKEAGFNHIYNGFVKDIFERSPEDAIRKYGGFDKQAGDSSDPFIQGQLEAVGEIEKIASSKRALGWYKFLKEAHEKNDIINFAKSASQDTINGDPEVVKGFLRASEDVLNSDQDIVKLAFSGPNFNINFNDQTFNTNINEEEMRFKQANYQSSFEAGAEEALGDIMKLAQQGYSFSDTLDAVSEVLEEDLNKYASEEEDDYKLGVDAICHDFLKTASALTASYQFDSDRELLIKTAECMLDPTVEVDTTDEYLMGKEAAFEEMVDMTYDGYSVADITNRVSNTIYSGIEKNASEESIDYKRGIDAACHDFVKHASELYGEYDLSNMNDGEIVTEVFEKIAKDEGFTDKVKRKAKEWGGAAKDKGRAALDYVKEKGGGAYGAAKEHVGNHPGKYGVAAGLGAAGLGAAGYAAHQHRKKKRQEEEGGRQKKASLSQHSRVAESLDYLQSQGIV